MHYIRFLSPPKVAGGTRSSLTVNAVVAVTTDLGDAFYPHDVTLRVSLVVDDDDDDGQQPGKVLQTQDYVCTGYSRALKVSLAAAVPGRYASRKVCVHVAAAAVDKAAHILDVWSTHFPLTDRQRAEPLVERRLSMSNGSVLRVLEETGDSIARHIWDASLGFLRFFDQALSPSVSASAPPPPPPPPPELQTLLSHGQRQRPLRVLELGAGCGIVGIAFAQLVKSDVLLTDLDDALDILKDNVRLAAPAAGSRLDAIVLDWASDLASLDSASASAQYDLILVSDCIYNPDSSVNLVETLERLSRRGLAPPLILVGYKHRHSADQVFFDRMRQANFTTLSTGSIRLCPARSDDDDDDDDDDEAASPTIEFYEYRLEG